MNKNILEQSKIMIDYNLEKLGIRSYLDDDKVTEIVINSNKTIFIKKLGEGFINTNLISINEEVINILNTLATLNKVSINTETPYISTELPLSKNRIEGLIPPVVANPKFNIRKKIPMIKTLESYRTDKFITKDQEIYFKKAVRDRKNIMVIGGTDTGKTTFANAIIREMEEHNERLIIIEEVEELQTTFLNVDKLKVIPEIFTPMKALKSSMRLSPERLIFGEVRGAEAFDLINGFNSGHAGGISTIHANDCYGGLKKLELYMQAATGKLLQDMIGTTVDILITLKMYKNKRILYEIVEVEGFDLEKHNYILKSIYKNQEIIEISEEEEWKKE